MAKKMAAKRAAKKSTALARRRENPPKQALMRVHDPKGMLPAEPALSDDPVLGALGLAEVKLTAKEEAALSAAVNVRDILIKPTGQPYLSHPAYTQLFNRAFGRLGWSLRPASNPKKAQSPGKKSVQIVRAYILYIHGKPVAFAEGEHEYWESNAEQSYGDALEATFASALRRCAKRIGVGLELWDRNFLDKFKREHCLSERVRYKDRYGNQQTKIVWRRRDQDPPANVEREPDDEPPADHGDVEPPRRQAPRSAGSDGNGALHISPAQSRRLFSMATKEAGRDWKNEVLPWLKSAYNAVETGTKPDRYLTLARTEYTAVCETVIAPGPLPKGRA